MSLPWWRWSRVLVAAAVLSIAGVARAQSPQGEQAAADARPHAGTHLGVATCASSLCHGSARPLSARNVQQNEYVTWSHFDPHARAYAVLLEEKGRRIAKHLGLKSAADSPECLACHAESTPATERGERFQLTDGVGCEACHGAAAGWIATHYDVPTVTHTDNLQKGMKALERPSVRAEVCAGCHVGDTSRFASHRMMAAGHPRLAFELDTYTELWRTAGGREHFRRDSGYARRKGSVSSMEVWLTGLAASTRRTADLIAQRAGAGHGGFPDFALYNCYSCHRAMKLQGWDSAEDDDALPPGSLKLQDGNARTLLGVLDALDPPRAAPLRDALRSLQRASGNAPLMLDAAHSMQQALAEVERSDLHGGWTRRHAEAALDALVSAARHGAFADYAAAEQAAMGMVLLLNEIGTDSARAKEVNDMFATLQDDAQFDKGKFARALTVFGEKQTAATPFGKEP